ncbi:Ig-like domain-containing protein [Kosmotoga pacifica]|uniref:Ig-like domain-containing protein n=1 Tax=Kosmotoga pacifica TaxID=1330330 RepID=UPI0012E02A38|nr:Ig-like domain-containing protein [Kosmotoga pacifica]
MITVNDVNRAPSIEIGNQVVNEGEVLEFNLEEYATDPDGDALSFTMISGVGRIEGNVYSYSPDYSDAGTYEVTIKVADGKGGEAQDSFTITVNDVNRAPIVEEITDQTMYEGKKISLPIVGNDPDGDLLTYELKSGPGMIISNIYSFKADYDDSGTYSVIIRVSDEKGAYTEITFTLVVLNSNRPPEVDIPNQNAYETEPINIQILDYINDPDGDEVSVRKVSGVGEINGMVTVIFTVYCPADS